MKALPVQYDESSRHARKLRRSEALKARCRQRHFDAIGIPFDVAVTANQVERAWNAPGIRYT